MRNKILNNACTHKLRICHPFHLFFFQLTSKNSHIRTICRNSLVRSQFISHSLEKSISRTETGICVHTMVSTLRVFHGFKSKRLSFSFISRLIISIAFSIFWKQQDMTAGCTLNHWECVMQLFIYNIEICRIQYSCSFLKKNICIWRCLLRWFIKKWLYLPYKQDLAETKKTSIHV